MLSSGKLPSHEGALHHLPLDCREPAVQINGRDGWASSSLSPSSSSSKGGKRVQALESGREASPRFR